MPTERDSSLSGQQFRSGQRWVTAKASIAAIQEVDPRVAEKFFGAPTSIALGGWPGSTTGRAWASCARFTKDVKTGAIPSTVRAVMYDPEGWEATPLEERQDPITYIRAFATLARGLGYFVIVTPHPGLVEVPGARCARAPGETRERAYLRSRIGHEAARYADACEIQAQRFQQDPIFYRELVSDAAAQARAANPDVLMLSGLSTHPGYEATPEMLYAAWESVRDMVDGHYLSLARLRHPAAAAGFLRMVARPAG
jgi:hypothetical protein